MPNLLSHPFDKEVYVMYLFMISEIQKNTSHIEDNQHLFYLDKVPVLKLYVQPTISRHYMKEVATGMNIPIQTLKNSFYEYNASETSFKITTPGIQPVHVISYIRETSKEKEIYYCTDYHYVTPDIIEFQYHRKEECTVSETQLKRYLNRYQDKEQFQKYLMEIFQTGKSRYENYTTDQSLEQSISASKTLKRTRANRFLTSKKEV